MGELYVHTDYSRLWDERDVADVRRRLVESLGREALRNSFSFKAALAFLATCLMSGYVTAADPFSPEAIQERIHQQMPAGLAGQDTETAVFASENISEVAFNGQTIDVLMDVPFSEACEENALIVMQPYYGAATWLIDKVLADEWDLVVSYQPTNCYPVTYRIRKKQ